MKFYDSFFENKHSIFFQKLLLKFNKNILDVIIKSFDEKETISILEIGPGKGYFYKSCIEYGLKIDYSAIDRNEKILNSLGIKNKYLSEIPKFPKINKKFDIIYVSYVVEHLNNGKDVFSFVKNCNNLLKKGGKLVLFVPDAMKLSMEFWNIDYTHIFPTTRRNLLMVLKENNFKNIDVFNVNGLFTCKWFTNYYLYLLLTIIVSIYSYKFWQFLWSLINPKDNNTREFFYKIFCFIQEKNLMIVANKNNTR